MIEFKNVYKTYPNGNVAIKNMSMSIEDAKFVIFIGPSGGGKTTALKMINRLEDATNGEILIDSKNILDYDINLLRQDMGYVLQQVALFPHYDVFKNIAVVPELKNWDKKRIKNRVYEMLEMVNLNPQIYANRMPNELSGGEAQRVAIARALAANPSYVLMDEPFSALDPATRSSLQEDIKKLQSHLQKTIIFVTHDIEEALLLGDQICIINGGEKLLCASKDELLSNEDEFIKEFIALGLRHRNGLYSKDECLKLAKMGTK
ncbi:ABC transporter ATP-binding protein [Campylobacter geochelonis]|uniref:Putative glutamine transport ATP-binding protein n=1 Tax=Campylobacter geochelonis TaxID=1780362 RepID=A0A128EDL2_9BACT|nr:ABC transporter ATP-binding protein [Campylobacter geochelonis]QKF72223.1 glycine betaine/L-proline ABC transporter, ATP binding subunit OpuBA [Campylobacter geochelonis]CZE46144.1 Putative glutamine transport ATP-binding protein [Campylobacter geochelonis]CZE46482.1 Putative glutamine transport ATP-binding protein [Campylobacter geochelonis]CZE50777.1 Putative glutamine transport ATP-binding protein [Campylobacter geochelonis]